MIAKSGTNPKNDGENLEDKKKQIDFNEAANNNEEKPEKPLAGGSVYPSNHKMQKLNGKKYIFTTAQNNTYVHKGFFEALKVYAKENDAEIIVLTTTYNKNAFQNSTKEDDGLWYDPLVTPYIMEDPASITENLTLGAELNILPTVKNPTNGLESKFVGTSGIIPHVKHDLKSLPRTDFERPRILWTTGACTQMNYIQKGAGQKAESHHVFGALVVEVGKDNLFAVRQIQAETNGAFYDLDKKYYPNGKVEKNKRVEVVTLGDIHIEKPDPAITAATVLNKDSVLKTLNPKEIHIHDLLDFDSRNHHNIKDEEHRVAHESKKSTVEGDILKAVKFLNLLEKEYPDSKIIIMQSNHDEAFTKWLKNADPKLDPTNAEFYYEAKAMLLKINRAEAEKAELALLESTIRHLSKTLSRDDKNNNKNRIKELKRSIKENTEGTKYANMLEWAIKRKIELKNTSFVKRSASHIICDDKQGGGIECSFHGDRGINGSRGTPNNYRKIGEKINIGHSHSLNIIDNVYSAGATCNLNQGYNSGQLTTVTNGHIVTYPNGKRTALPMVKDKNGDGFWRVKPTKKRAPKSANQNNFDEAAAKGKKAPKPVASKKPKGPSNG